MFREGHVTGAANPPKNSGYASRSCSSVADGGAGVVGAGVGARTNGRITGVCGVSRQVRVVGGGGSVRRKVESAAAEMVRFGGQIKFCRREASVVMLSRPFMSM